VTDPECGRGSFDRALSDHQLFFKVTDGYAAVDLLDRTRTRDGSVESRDGNWAVKSLLHALTPPGYFMFEF